MKILFTFSFNAGIYCSICWVFTKNLIELFHQICRESQVILIQNLKIRLIPLIPPSSIRSVRWELPAADVLTVALEFRMPSPISSRHICLIKLIALNYRNNGNVLQLTIYCNWNLVNDKMDKMWSYYRNLPFNIF